MTAKRSGDTAAPSSSAASKDACTPVGEELNQTASKTPREQVEELRKARNLAVDARQAAILRFRKAERRMLAYRRHPDADPALVAKLQQDRLQALDACEVAEKAAQAAITAYNEFERADCNGLTQETLDLLEWDV